MTVPGVVIVRDADGTNAIGEPNLLAYPKDYVSGSKTGVIFCHAAQEHEAPWLSAPAGFDGVDLTVGITSGSNIITGTGFVGGYAGYAVQGPGIPAATHLGFTDSTHLTLLTSAGGVLANALATATGTVTVQLGHKYTDLFYSIASAGYPIVSTYMGGDLWGNDTAIAFIEAARTLLATIAKAGGVMMVGTSMGGLSVYNYMRAHPANVKTGVLVCPVSDLNDSGIQGSFSASINAAYPPAYSDALYGNMHNPLYFCTALADTPMQLWVNDDDATARPVVAVQTINAFRQADVHHGLGGHNNLNDMDIDRVVSWLDAHQ